MANDRLYLVHRPSNNRVLLGKLFGDWHTMPQLDLEQRIAAFFYEVGYVPGYEFDLETEIEKPEEKT